MIALQARWGGKPIRLGPNEFRLLRYFAENPDRVLSRQDLISALGKREPALDERTVDVWGGRLRRAIRAASGGSSEEPTSELQSIMRNSYAVFCVHKKQHTTILTKIKGPRVN